MMKTLIPVKVCGMTDLAQVDELVKLGVQYAGFIFYEPSPRTVIGKIAAADLAGYQQSVQKVGVFVNEEARKVLEIVKDYGLNLVQLHGEESPGYCRELSGGVKVIKAFRLQGDENISAMLGPYMDCVDMFLFDTKTSLYGGSGKKFDWKVLANISADKPFFLSGGIGPGDETMILNFLNQHPDFQKVQLDLNSRFETAPGVKDMSKLKTFMSNLGY